MLTETDVTKKDESVNGLLKAGFSRRFKGPDNTLINGGPDLL